MNIKIVRFLGGLGNQMFQHAFYKALENRNMRVYADLTQFNSYKLHNGFELSSVFDIKLKPSPKLFLELLKPEQDKWIYRKLRRILGLKKSYQEEAKWFCYDTNVFRRGVHYYWGYWQNEKYFDNIRAELLEDFSFRKPLSDSNQQILNAIQDSQSVSLHVRRGDYLNDTTLGGICNITYYKNAIDYMEKNLNNPVFFVFSDDIIWCKENLCANNLIFVDVNTGANSFVDMQLMSNCKHNIIANSSFSWWGAWLNQNADKKIICPAQWSKTSDESLALNGWIKL